MSELPDDAYHLAVKLIARAGLQPARDVPATQVTVALARAVASMPPGSAEGSRLLSALSAPEGEELPAEQAVVRFLLAHGVTPTVSAVTGELTNRQRQKAARGVRKPPGRRNPREAFVDRRLSARQQKRKRGEGNGRARPVEPSIRGAEIGDPGWWACPRHRRPVLFKERTRDPRCDCGRRLEPIRREKST